MARRQLFEVNCITKKDSALYTNSDSIKDELMDYEYVSCDIEFVDYKTATLCRQEAGWKERRPKGDQQTHYCSYTLGGNSRVLKIRSERR